MFLSPAFPTRAHPGARTLGAMRFGLIAGRSVHAKTGRRPLVIALGGMNGCRFRRLAALGADGWAAIDAWDRP